MSGKFRQLSFLILCFAAVALAAVLAIVAARLAESHYMPTLKASAVPAGAPTLNSADIDKLLTVDGFRISRRVRQVPLQVKESFSNITRLPFDLVDPGEPIMTDDMTGAKSSRRLVFLGLRDDSAILVYEQGGFVDACNLVAFWFPEGGRDWGGTVYDQRIPSNISGLRTAFKQQKLRPWHGQE